ncbi:hypothetical protein, partial [Nonomuraea mesophila]|uniref:hypothetical protein n=1 Tax=Nonomuraea mesophila TaxID=2530382 RepID=UPI00140A51FD
LTLRRGVDGTRPSAESEVGRWPVPVPSSTWFREDGAPPAEETHFDVVAVNGRLTRRLILRGTG